MNILAKLSFIIGLCLSQQVTRAQDLNVTSKVDDFVTQNQRQYAAKIESNEAQLAAYRTNYVRQLSALDTQSSLIEEKLRETEAQLNPLELLGGLSKHCVQKYREQLTSLSVVKTTLSNCRVTANNNLNNFVSAPEATNRNLVSYYNNQLKSMLADCLKKHGNAQLNYTLCVTQVITSTNSVTITNQKTFTNQMQVADCSGENRIKESLDCGFSVIYRTVSQIGETLRLIDNCINGFEICPPCESESEKCKNVLDLSLTPSDFRNATIQNPFYGMNNTASCVRVNFRNDV